MASTPAPPLARDWTDEKNASVDWSDPEDVLANRLTFLQILLMHPKLAAHMATHKEAKEAARAVFMSSSLDPRVGATAQREAMQHAEQVALLQAWHAQQLLTLRASRWCRHCGGEGHTRRVCPLRQEEPGAAANAGEAERRAILSTRPTTSGSAAPSASAPRRPTIMEKLLAHQQRIERLKLLEEKKRRATEGSGSSASGSAKAHRGARGGQRGGGGGGGGGGSVRQIVAEEGELFTDERRRGVIVRLDAQFNLGFIRAAEMGEVKFFLSNADYGVKTISVNDTVIFKPDNSRNFPLAIDVRPEKPVITREDVANFVRHCSRAAHPIDVITMLLTHTHEWSEVLRLVNTSRPGSSGAAGDADFNYAQAMHTFVEMTTFIGNRDPIHLTMLRSFLRLLLTRVPPLAAEGPGGAGGSPRAGEAAEDGACFYPDMLHAALQADAQRVAALAAEATTEAQNALLYLSEQWVEVANFVVFLRQYTDVAPAHVRSTADVLIPFFEARLAEGGAALANRRALALAIQRLQYVTGVRGAESEDPVSLIPAAAELAVPPPNSASVFTPSNLPVNGEKLYGTTEAFIAAQRKLLRADTFEATSRVMPAACYTLPDYAPSAETVADLEHARVFWRVRFVARVVTRDRDFTHPISHILQIAPKSAKASMAAQLHEGTTVFISTSPDKARMTDDEMFWGVVSSCDSHLLKAGMIIVAPCEESTSFDKLEANLRRNEAAGQTELSLLMETPIFMAGYASIMRALDAFVGPLSMPLPMAKLIVGPQVNEDPNHHHHSEAAGKAVDKAPTGTGELLPYIPPHCEHAFRELTKDIRGRFHLDAGQDAVMRRLPTSRILLVQGPPGTGKSFIGCRVVETYVRYKQMAASGDILQKISVDMLGDEAVNGTGKWDRLLPQVGPVVVITYKNHALDEFLVDLLNCGLWDAARPRVGQQLSGGATATAPAATQEMFPGGRRLIRIGGRSREPRLEGHNLGSIMHSTTPNATIKSLKERVFVLNQRLEKLLEQVHYLESGRVPRSHFERWLTTDQRQSISFADKDAWLRGERYVGVSQRTNTDPQLYLRLLRTNIAAAMMEAVEHAGKAGTATSRDSAATAAREATEAAESDEDISLSVFQEMKREDERREFNDALHKTYLSAESIHLATHPPTRPAAVPAELLSLWSLDPVARHEYYAYLIQQSIAAKAKVCLVIMENIASVVQIRSHAMDEAKLALLRGADVVGLTTTGCAMHQNLLRSLRPSVLVVEEAAEVLESQLLACMTDSLEQIILIGDHYQLQPKVDTFLYEKVNKLNLSLFERLARRVMPIVLTEQRRMHPTIAQLVRPFYDTQPLVDHPSVLRRSFITSSGQAYRDGVPGLAKRVFFWRHEYPEEEAPGSRSKVNMRETLMAKQLSLHLVAEGVSQTSITIITPYLGQCRMLRSVLRMSSLTEVRVSTVDLFQGDENDVIILSMTRTEKLTEFIRMRNRLIVSCSRARFAMVMVGNDTLLRKSGHWATVLSHLDADGCVGEQLPITFRAAPGTVSFMEVKETLSAARVVKDIDKGAVALSAKAAAPRRPAALAKRVANSAMDDDEDDEYMRLHAAHSATGNEEDGEGADGENYDDDNRDDGDE